jgi:uncharacterized protein YciI
MECIDLSMRRESKGDAEMHFAVIYAPGPAWTESETEHNQVLERHIAYQRRRLAEGSLFLGGPFAGGPGGMAVFEAASKEEVEAILAEDPAIASGFYVVTIHPWRIASRRE